MANVWIEENTMSAIGNAIRSKTGKTSKILPANMASEINNISAKLQTKTVAPTSEGVTVYPDNEYDGLSSVKIPAEANLIPENIAEDVSIFGITGTYKGKGIEEISTEAEMDALLISENIGKVYRYIGEDTDKYINGDLYEVEESEDA